jgi:hypothetical protein
MAGWELSVWSSTWRGGRSLRLEAPSSGQVAEVDTRAASIGRHQLLPAVGST